MPGFFERFSRAEAVRPGGAEPRGSLEHSALESKPDPASLGGSTGTGFRITESKQAPKNIREVRISPGTGLAIGEILVAGGLGAGIWGALGNGLGTDLHNAFAGPKPSTGGDPGPNSTGGLLDQIFGNPKKQGSGTFPALAVGGLLIGGALLFRRRSK